MLKQFNKKSLKTKVEKTCWGNWILIHKTMKLNPSVTPNIIMNSERVTELNVKAKAIQKTT